MNGHSAIPNTTHRTRWQRFIDWLAGGPPDPEKIAAARLKPWYKRYQLSLVIWGGWLVVMAYPQGVTHLNAKPDFRQLETVQVHIVQTRDRDPHFVMEWPDGQQRSVYWPKTVTFFGAGSFHLWTSTERQALVGCRATARISSIRYWVLAGQYRVWALSCPSIGFEIGSDQTQQIMGKELKIGLDAFLGVTLFVLAPLGFVFFLRERRGVL